MSADTLSHAMELQYSSTVYDQLLELTLKVRVVFKDAFATPDNLSQLTAEELLQGIDSTSSCIHESLLFDLTRPA